MPDPFLSGDAPSVEFDREALRKAVKGTRREQLEAIRDYIADQLENNMCSTCKASRLRTGDQASLILRLQAVLTELDAVKSAESTTNRLSGIRGSVSNLDEHRQRHSVTGTRAPGGGRRVGS